MTAATVLVPCEVSELAEAALSATRGIERSLHRFATSTRLEAMPSEIDAAIDCLTNLRPAIVALRAEAASPNPDTTILIEGEAAHG